ncbi:hypothetical protein MXB_5719 [Myxobolus squamalis]|nr:hypothetical protein MXB_5719 [Myxobolus squamalis]
MNLFKVSLYRRRCARFIDNAWKSIYDRKENKVLQRSPIQFVYACIFYIIFYATLISIAALTYFSIQFVIFGFGKPSPKAIQSRTLSSFPSLICITDFKDIGYYESSNSATYTKYTQSITKALEGLAGPDKSLAYKNPNADKICGKDGKYETGCEMNIDNLGPCKADPYGFGTNTPCVYFRISNVF